MNSQNRKSFISIGAAIGLLVTTLVVLAGLGIYPSKVQANYPSSPAQLILYDYES